MSDDLIDGYMKSGLVGTHRRDIAGTEEGEICNRDGCKGKMGYEPVRDCSCHLYPPCSRCVDNPLVCLECEADAEQPTAVVSKQTEEL